VFNGVLAMTMIDKPNALGEDMKADNGSSKEPKRFDHDGFWKDLRKWI